MRGDENKRQMLQDIIVKVERDGDSQTFRGVPNRSAYRRRLSRARKVRARLVEAGRSLAAFVSGLMLASLYGLMALLLQNQPMWFCVYTTVVLGGLVGFGMGLSAGVRASVMVMLPSMCSAHGRKFLLLLFVSVLLSGPLSNTLENTERAASSLLCGAELAANQTQELMQKAAAPLFSVLDKVRQISSNAYAVAGRVQNFINALADSVRHVAGTLRNVLHFLVDIGDVCNDKLGAPYRKCRDMFAEARSDCVDLLGEFDFLCDIVDGFLPLCNLARAGELFCVIPSYIGAHLKQRLADPTVAAFRKMMSQFDFNISASVRLDMDANSSRSLQQASQDIMREISSELQVFRRLSEPLTYGSVFLLAVTFLRAVQYRRRYLSELDFDNVYIDARFKELDRRLTTGGGASLLPLTRRETRTYITPLSFRLSGKERRAVLTGVASVLRYLLIGSLLVALDFLVFWILDQVHHQVKGDVVARAPVSAVVQVQGSGYASDIYRDLVASFDTLQGGNVTVISGRCLIQPSEPSYVTCFILGFLLGLALLVSLTGGFMQRCRRLICASYHPERELERIHFLHQQILDQRRTVGRALKRSAVRNQADREEGGEGGGRSRLQALLMRLPGGARLSHLLAPPPSVTCLACGEVLRPKDEDTVSCDVPRCSGVYCRPCFHSLGRTCVVCMRPLTFQEDSEEELDSSDDEQLSLWSAALNSTRISDCCARRLMKRRISTATRRRPQQRSDGGVSRTDGGDEGPSDGSVHSDSELSEADMTYQDRPRSDDSDSDASLQSIQSPDGLRLKNQPLHTVCVQSPESS